MRRACALAALAALVATASARAADITVMSYDFWGGGVNQGNSVDETVALISAAGADLMGVQETRAEGDPCDAENCLPAGPSVAGALAEALGLHLHEQSAENSAPEPMRFSAAGRSRSVPTSMGPFPSSTPRSRRSPPRRRRAARRWICGERSRRGRGAAAVFLTGDINEHSHLDRTGEAVATGRHLLTVRWRNTARIERLGFVDSFRTVHPDPMARPGLTWTPQGDP